MRLDIYNNREISDIPLTGNPQITYFKSVYRKHTHFSIKRHRMGCKASNVLNRIDHMGDLIKSIDLEINITGNTTTPINNIGTELIDEIKLYVGSEVIEKLSGSYIEMHMELKNPRTLKTFMNVNGSNIVCNQGTMEQILSLSGGVLNPSKSNASKVDIVLPIPFSFCRDVGYAFPIFLFHLDKPLSISFKTNTNVMNGSFEYNFIINNILLTENERMRFKTSHNEYLHERIHEQKITLKSGENSFPIDPVGNIKSIMWKNAISKDYKYNISINTNKLFNHNKSYHYFTRKTISDAGYPGGGCINNNDKNVKNDDSIGFYSFALKDYSKEDQLAPTGSISSNANKINFIVKNNSTTETETNFIVYMKAYNIINISDGYFKLKYQH